jgi:hypothetical protein
MTVSSKEARFTLHEVAKAWAADNPSRSTDFYMCVLLKGFWEQSLSDAEPDRYTMLDLLRETIENGDDSDELRELGKKWFDTSSLKWVSDENWFSWLGTHTSIEQYPQLARLALQQVEITRKAIIELCKKEDIFPPLSVISMVPPPEKAPKRQRGRPVLHDYSPISAALEDIVRAKGPTSLRNPAELIRDLKTRIRTSRVPPDSTLRSYLRRWKRERLR